MIIEFITATLTVVYISSLSLYFTRLILKAKKLAIISPKKNTPLPNSQKTDSFLSVIVAVKDGEKIIEQCVESILSQNHPNLELVVVNDRSQDNTKEILMSLQKRYPNSLQAVHIYSLPTGWGGQNHAIQCGVKRAQGEWLCFTDADCQLLSNSSLSCAMTYSSQAKTKFLSVLPELATPSRWEKFYLPVFSFIHAMRLRILDVNSKNSDAAYANGAFLLIEKSTYKLLGEHEAVKYVINDDTRLAALAKRKKVNVTLVGSRDLIQTRMYDTPSTAWHGWIRNTYSTRFEGVGLLKSLFCIFSFALLPWIYMLSLLFCYDLSTGISLPLWIATLFFSHLTAAVVYHNFGFSYLWSLLYFPASLFAFAIVATSGFKALFRKPISWHGVTYPPPTKLEG